VPDLPPDVISVLLQHVSPKDRLTSCAFVCKAWHEACCCSIDNITLACSKQAKAHNAFKWLAKRGKNTITVHMTVAEAAEKLCLDCHLQEWSWVKDLRLTGKVSNKTWQMQCWGVCAGHGGGHMWNRDTRTAGVSVLEVPFCAACCAERGRSS
jgi:hypothetical protein